MILTAHIFLAIIISALSIYFKSRPPKGMNPLYGYRTRTSMRNPDTWEEANRFSAGLQVKFALAFVGFDMLSYCLIGGLNSFYLSCSFLTLGSIAIIPITEYHLRNTFDQEGKRLKE